MTFHPITIDRLRAQVSLCQTEVTDLEQKVEQARKQFADWSLLLSHAEAGVGEQLQAEKTDETVPPKVLGELDAGWCWCGLPGTPGMTHNLTECRAISEITFDGAFRELSRAQDRMFGRGDFEPYVLPATSTEQPGGQA